MLYMRQGVVFGSPRVMGPPFVSHRGKGRKLGKAVAHDSNAETDG